VGRPPKRIRFTLGFDRYTVEGETDKILVFRFATPQLARAAFDEHFAKAGRRHRLAAVDTTRIPGALAADRDRLQLEWDGDHITRAWFADAALAERARALPEFQDLTQLAIGNDVIGAS
jgi:hypothetical protein